MISHGCKVVQAGLGSSNANRVHAGAAHSRGECSLHQCSSSIYIQALYCGQVSRPEAGSALRAQLQTVASLHRPALCRAQIAGSSRIAPLSQSNRAQPFRHCR